MMGRWQEDALTAVLTGMCAVDEEHVVSRLLIRFGIEYRSVTVLGRVCPELKSFSFVLGYC